MNLFYQIGRMMNMPQKETLLTYEGLKKLEEELEYLKTEKRKEIAERIKVALGFGDLSPEEILSQLQERLNIFQVGVEAYASRLSKDKNLTFSWIDYPAIPCLCCTKTFENSEDIVKAGYELHAEAVLRGYKLLSTTPPSSASG